MKSVNDGLSAYIMGRNYYCEEEGYKLNYQLSYDYYKKGVDEFDDPRCLYGVAMFYYDDGVSPSENVVLKDNKYANQLFKKAYPKIVELAKASDKYAIFILGAYYNYGLGGIKRSLPTAIKFIEQAADLGHPGAIYDMARFYESGHGVEKNVAKAAQFYERASRLGKVQARAKAAEYKGQGK